MSSGRVWASRCTGFSCCRAGSGALGPQRRRLLDSRAQAQGLWHRLVPAWRAGSSRLRGCGAGWSLRGARGLPGSGCGAGWSLRGTRGLPGLGAVAQAGPCVARGVFPAQGLWRRLVLAWRTGSLGSRLACFPVLAGGVCTAEPPGKPLIVCVVVVVLV